MTDSQANDRRLLLLAYLDGELPAEKRESVAAWLAGDPDAQEILHELKALSPTNKKFWQSVEPPAPSDVEWERVRLGLNLPKSGPRYPVRQFALLAGLAAAIIIGIFFSWPRPQQDQQPVAQSPPVVSPTEPAIRDPLADFAVLPIATPTDVIIRAVQGDTMNGLIASDPLGDVPLVLADTQDLDVAPSRPSFFTIPWELSQPEPTDLPVLMGKGR